MDLYQIEQLNMKSYQVIKKGWKKTPWNINTVWCWYHVCCLILLNIHAFIPDPPRYFRWFEYVLKPKEQTRQNMKRIRITITYSMSMYKCKHEKDVNLCLIRFDSIRNSVCIHRIMFSNCSFSHRNHTCMALCTKDLNTLCVWNCNARKSKMPQTKLRKYKSGCKRLQCNLKL